ncbi:T9SS type A sorting domain-containing protein, partial [candidate division KSB1 bacterium]|nr:T9SS type A sorting domain-containing protein [candidate division KSB1 bacterium]
GQTLWIGTGNGLARFAAGTWKTFHSSTSDLPDDFVYALAVDAHGNKWIGTGSGGLALYREGGVRTNIEARPNDIAARFSLSQNYPNPFASRKQGAFGGSHTTISYALPKAGVVTLKVYDALGREVAVLAQHEFKMAGTHQATFEARDLPSGQYFYRLEVDGFVVTKKMVLAR